MIGRFVSRPLQVHNCIELEDRSNWRIDPIVRVILLSGVQKRETDKAKKQEKAPHLRSSTTVLNVKYSIEQEATKQRSKEAIVLQFYLGRVRIWEPLKP